MNPVHLGNVPRALIRLSCVLVASGALACSTGDEGLPAAGEGEQSDDLGETRQALLGLSRLPNDVPIPNAGGAAATFSTAGFIDLENPFHKPQGTNGRSCETCHLLTAGWSIRPLDVEVLFALTGGTHPLFNLLDADSPSADVTTREARRASYSMLRQGLFRRSSNLAATAEFEITAVDDPLGAGGNLTRFVFFRRPLATSNFLHTRNVGWHDQNANGTGDVTLGLDAQAKGNITGAQQGPPATQALVDSIVNYEKELWFAQVFTLGAGRLDDCGARGGPALLSQQPFVAGRFNLFDAWIDGRGCASTPHRRKIARGQELFNNRTILGGGLTCRTCHNAENSGSHVGGVLFDVGASAASRRLPGMPLYTVRNKTTLETIQTTDPGRAGSTGRWADLNRFKVPSMRGVAARAPYFHNGVSATLVDVIRLYEEVFGFDFSPSEESDLVAFMNAL
jgi:cytochrome c peroxidase